MRNSTFTTTDGVVLSYLDQGPPSAPCVVLIAGYGAPATSWVLQWKPLLKAGYRVVSFDRRSHGRSQHPKDGHTMKRHAEDLNELLNLLNADKPLLVGQSMGASSILAYIEQFGDERIGAIVNIDQTPKMVNDASWSLGMYGLTPETLDTFFNDPIPDPVYAKLSVKTQITLLKSMLGQPKFNTEGTKPLLLDHAAADWRDALRKTSVPVLFIAGANSPFWPCEHAKESAALCKNGESVVIPECGHAVNWERVDACNAVLSEFLVRVMPAGLKSKE
jgi:pimeloyl-ACP methyl ester carboxylesterase